MLSTQEIMESLLTVTKEPHLSKELLRHCTARQVGRAGFCRSPASVSRRRQLLHSATTTKKFAAVCKLRTVKRQSESVTARKNSCFDGLFPGFEDHAYWGKSNQRRSSLPMDYRWLAGMTPKWYAGFRKRRSLSDYQNETYDVETTECDVDVHNGISVCPDLPCNDVLNKTSNKGSTDTASPFSSSYCFVISQLTGTGTSQNSKQGHVYSEPTALKLGHSAEKYSSDGYWVPDGDSADGSVVLRSLLTSAVSKQYRPAPLSRQSRLAKTHRKRHLNKQLTHRVGHCDIEETTGIQSKDGDVASSADSSDSTVSACSVSSCSCYCFCDSQHVECASDTPLKSTVSPVDWMTCAKYIGCDGSHKVAVDLHVVGAVETVADYVATSRQMISATDVHERGDFVDNICVDCGCELTNADAAVCVYSVPVCSICSQDANNNMPSVESSSSVEHSYASLTTDHLVPQFQKIPSNISTPSEEPKVPDIDVVDDITFLSFPSKLAMHRYILSPQNSSDPAIRSSWRELVRCERYWHVGHKPQQRVWFGSMKHRHVDRFSAHNRLNEQIELGLMKPVSSQHTKDLLGITLGTASPQQNSDRKLKHNNGHFTSELQRPARLAAQDRDYCLTRVRRKRDVLTTVADAEHIDVMKLTRQQAEEALELLQLPTVTVRNNCSKPGCQFGCICELLDASKFSSTVGAEFNTFVTVPEFPCIDDSWRRSQLSSADSICTSGANDSCLQSSNCGTDMEMSVSNNAVEDSPLMSESLYSNAVSGIGASSPAVLLASQSPGDGHKFRGKSRARTRRLRGVSGDRESVSHRRRLPSLLDDNVESTECSPSQTSLCDSSIGLATPDDIRSEKSGRRKRKLSQILPSHGEDRIRRRETRHKRRRKSAGAGTLRETPKKGAEDGPAATTLSQTLTMKAGMGQDTAANIQDLSTENSISAQSNSNTATVRGSEPVRNQLRLQNVATGELLLLQHVAKGPCQFPASVKDARGVALYAVRSRNPASGDRTRCSVKSLLNATRVVGPRDSGTPAAIPRLVRLPLQLSSARTASFTQSVLKQQFSPKSSSATPSLPIDSSSRMPEVTRRAPKQPSSPFRIQMILFQQKQDSTMLPSSDAVNPCLLEVASNCAWEGIRPKVLAYLANLIRLCDSYPPTSASSIDGFRVEVQPRAKHPTEIPPRLRESLGMSTMFPIRVRITQQQMCLLPASSGSVPVVSSAGAASGVRQAGSNGLTAGSLRSLLVTTACRKTTADMSQLQSPTSTTPDGNCPKVAHASGGTPAVVQQQRETERDCDEPRVCGINSVSKSCNVDGGSTLNTAAVCAYSDNVDHCIRLPRLLEKADAGSITVELTDPAFNRQCGDDRDFQRADDGDFRSSANDRNTLSSTAAKLTVSDSTEITCSLSADGGNFPASSGLNVSVVRPLDLCT